MSEDFVNHPKHYTFGTIEVIDVIEDWRLCYHLGNVLKYLARSRYKGKEQEDLKKAEWYLTRFVTRNSMQIPTKDFMVNCPFEKVMKDWNIDSEIEKVLAGIYFGNYTAALEKLRKILQKN